MIANSTCRINRQDYKMYKMKAPYKDLIHCLITWAAFILTFEYCTNKISENNSIKTKQGYFEIHFNVFKKNLHDSFTYLFEMGNAKLNKQFLTSSRLWKISQRFYWMSNNWVLIGTPNVLIYILYYNIFLNQRHTKMFLIFEEMY